MPEEQEACCPHCGGTDGYYFKSIQEYEQSKDWHGEAEGCCFLRIVRETKPRCVDCQKLVNLNHS